MVSIRSSRSGSSKAASSSAPPPCFAERHYPLPHDVATIPDPVRGREPGSRPSSVDRLSDPVTATLPASEPADAVILSAAFQESLETFLPAAGPQEHRSLVGFVEVLLHGDADVFRAALDEALAAAGDLRRLESTHLAPAARILGDLWLADECDFLAVTIAVARMECLYRRLALQHREVVVPDRARRILLAPAPGNQHSFGLTLVEERFRESGWTVDGCGIGDGMDMLRLAAANAYDVIGISVHCGASASALSMFLARVRRVSCNRSAVLLGGGSLAIDNDHSLFDAGFDRLAEDAASAVREAEAALVFVPAATGFRAAAE